MTDTAKDNGIEYRIARPGDEDAIKDLLFYEFFKREPISIALKMNIPLECRAFVDIHAPRACTSGLSIVAIDRLTGQVVGVRTIIHASPEIPPISTFPKDDENCRKLNRMFELYARLKDGMDIYKEYDVDKLAYFRALAVKSEYCRRGVALRMVQESLEACKAQDYRLVIGGSTSFYSQRVFEKVGFKTIKVLAYKDYFVDGRQLIPCEGEHSSIRFHVKEL